MKDKPQVKKTFEKLETVYELTFIVLRNMAGRVDGRQRFFHTGDMPQIRATIKRLSDFAMKERDLPMPKEPKKGTGFVKVWSDVIMARYPTVGYAYSIVKVKRYTIEECESRWPCHATKEKKPGK